MSLIIYNSWIINEFRWKTINWNLIFFLKMLLGKHRKVIVKKSRFEEMSAGAVHTGPMDRVAKGDPINFAGIS